MLNLRQQIPAEAQAGMDRQQREYFLREQMRAIQKELGEGSAEETLADEMREKIEAAGMPEEVQAKALVQVERLEQQHPFSPEIGVIRTYLEWLTELPWAIETEDRLDLDEAAEILDEDHYGLEKVKERIIEYIAVRKLAGDKLRAPIICFVGPPGVGKTSLGRSIARAIGRNYVRMSLGGVRDEAEIRGHRRTYVGAMPGRVIKALRDAKSRNPVLVLDEIDKVGSDAFRGDPSSALLEVLDPEQNSTFSDHYLEVPFDLSQGDLHHDRQPAGADPGGAARPHGNHRGSGLHRGREAGDRARLPACRRRSSRTGLTAGAADVTDDALRAAHPRVHQRIGRPQSGARDRLGLPQGGARSSPSDDPPSTDHDRRRRRVETTSACRATSSAWPKSRTKIGVATGAAVTSVGGDLLSIEVTAHGRQGRL